MNEKYINKNVSEDDERYFDFQTFCEDFMEDNYKKSITVDYKKWH